MKGRARASGPRSGLYSNQRYTNWTPHDPHWSEALALPPRMRARAEVPLGIGEPVEVFERPLAPGFVLPVTVGDVVAVLGRIPSAFLSGLTGVYLMAGTAKQRRRRSLTFGLYQTGRIHLFPVPQQRLVEGWRCASRPADLAKYTKFGAITSASEGGSTTLTFDDESLRRFYLYDVLLHEIGHHVDRFDSARYPERFALWFAEFHYSQLNRG